MMCSKQQKAPVIASHSDLRAVCDIPRNMNDDMLRALAKNGGVVFINFNAAYLDRAAYDIFDPLRSARDAEIKAMMEKYASNRERLNYGARFRGNTVKNCRQSTGRRC